MDITEFERSLAADGYVAVPKQVPAETVVTDHSHAWDVRALVTDGQITLTLTIDTVATTYQTGEIFTMAANCIHHEQVGPNGVEYLAGRRDPSSRSVAGTTTSPKKRWPPQSKRSVHPVVVAASCS
jgi:hypothetical protein